jgi:hypothetical protein
VSTAGPPVVKRNSRRPCAHAGEAPHLGPQREAARDAGGQILREVVDPAALVHPARHARLGAVDREQLDGRARVAEGDHRLREPHRHLAHVLGEAFGREGLDAWRGGARAEQGERD